MDANHLNSKYPNLETIKLYIKKYCFDIAAKIFTPMRCPKKCVTKEKLAMSLPCGAACACRYRGQDRRGDASLIKGRALFSRTGMLPFCGHASIKNRQRAPKKRRASRRHPSGNSCWRQLPRGRHAPPMITEILRYLRSIPSSLHAEGHLVRRNVRTFHSNRFFACFSLFQLEKPSRIKSQDCWRVTKHFASHSISFHQAIN